MKLLLLFLILAVAILTSCRGSKTTSKKEFTKLDSSFASRIDSQSFTSIKIVDSVFAIPEKKDTLIFRGLPENADTTLLEDDTIKIIGRRLPNGRIKLIAKIKARKGYKRTTTETKTQSLTLQQQRVNKALKSIFESATIIKQPLQWWSWWWVLLLILILYLIYRLSRL